MANGGNALDPYDRNALLPSNALDPRWGSQPPLYMGPVGSERVGGDQSLTMPSQDVSPIAGWYGQHPVTAATRSNALNLAGNMMQFGPADVGAIRAFHGSLNEFEAFDPAKVGSGAMAGRWAPEATHANEYYLTTNKQHAETYGPVVHEFQIDAPLLQKDAKGDLESWAKENGYGSAQEHINDYYGGSVYDALNADNYFKDALSEAKEAGFPGVHVSFGNLKMNYGDRKVPVGDFVILHDPSVARKVDQ